MRWEAETTPDLVASNGGSGTPAASSSWSGEHTGSLESAAGPSKRRESSAAYSRESLGGRSSLAHGVGGSSPYKGRKRLGRGQILTSGNLKVWTTMVSSSRCLGGFDIVKRVDHECPALRRTHLRQHIDGEPCRRTSLRRRTISSWTGKVVMPRLHSRSRCQFDCRSTRCGLRKAAEAGRPRCFPLQPSPLKRQRWSKKSGLDAPRAKAGILREARWRMKRTGFRPPRCFRPRSEWRP